MTSRSPLLSSELHLHGSRSEEPSPRPAQRLRGAHQREGDEEVLRRAHLHQISPRGARRAFNARDLTKCPEVNKIFGIEVEPRFCTPTNVDGQQDDTTGDEYKAK